MVAKRIPLWMFDLPLAAGQLCKAVAELQDLLDMADKLGKGEALESTIRAARGRTIEIQRQFGALHELVQQADGVYGRLSHQLREIEGPPDGP